VDRVGNNVINFFPWKRFKRLDKAGVPDIYKRFRIRDASFMFYMYIHHESYTYNAWRGIVTNKTVDKDGHIWYFLSHDNIFVLVHKHNNHWVLFVICPA
jgi:hypothetical protein